LRLDELYGDEGSRAAQWPAAVQALIETPEKPARPPPPSHMPRQEEVHEPSWTCPNCGGAMRKLGEDVTEVLDYVPGLIQGDPPRAPEALMPRL
jgi:transposase